MQKVIELIDKVRFAELKKIDRLSKAQEAYLDQGDVFIVDSSN